MTKDKEELYFKRGDYAMISGTIRILFRAERTALKEGWLSPLLPSIICAGLRLQDDLS
jgi:hypothetical protein